MISFGDLAFFRTFLYNNTWYVKVPPTVLELNVFYNAVRSGVMDPTIDDILYLDDHVLVSV